MRESDTAAYSGGAAGMTALSPHSAVAYLRELSCDVRAVAVLGPGEEVLAGAPPGGGDVVRARGSGHEIALGLGPHALAALASHDAERALEALESRK